MMRVDGQGLVVIDPSEGWFVERVWWRVGQNCL